MEQNGTLTPRQERAITALLTCPTVEEAAKTAQVGKVTIYRWLKDETFSLVLEQARREQARDALNFLRSCMLKAAQRLNGLLDSDSEGTALKAAVALLDFGLRACAVADLTDRIVMLEEAQKSEQH